MGKRAWGVVLGAAAVLAGCGSGSGSGSSTATLASQVHAIEVTLGDGIAAEHQLIPSTGSQDIQTYLDAIGEYYSKAATSLQGLSYPSGTVSSDARLAEAALNAAARSVQPGMPPSDSASAAPEVNSTLTALNAQLGLGAYPSSA